MPRRLVPSWEERCPQDTEQLVADTVERYRREYDRYAKLAKCVAEVCRHVLEENAIRATIDWRPKSPQSLARKLARLMATPAQGTAPAWPEDRLALVSDLAGVRVKTYVEADRWKVVEDIRLNFDGPGEVEAVHVEVKDGTQRLYRATHCQVSLRRRSWVGRYENLRGLSCEIQVCSMLAHVWNEIEHGLIYKSIDGSPSADERKLLERLGRLTQLGDVALNDLLEANRRRLAYRKGRFVDQFDFATRMREKFPAAKNFEMHALSLLEEFLTTGLVSPEAVEARLLQGAYDHTWQRLFSEFRAYQAISGDWGVVLDPDSSDQLLVLFLDQQASQVLLRHQAARTRGRLPRIARLARRFVEMQRERERGAVVDPRFGDKDRSCAPTPPPRDPPRS